VLEGDRHIKDGFTPIWKVRCKYEDITMSTQKQSLYPEEEITKASRRRKTIEL
jgi:hypothetical protein